MIITTVAASEKFKKQEVNWEAVADLLIGFKVGYDRYELAVAVMFGLEEELRAMFAGFNSGIFSLAGENARFGKAGAYELVITQLPEAGNRVAAATLKQLGVATNDILGRCDGPIKFAVALPSTSELEVQRQLVSWLSLRVEMPIPRDSDYPGFSTRLYQSLSGSGALKAKKGPGDLYLYFDKARYSAMAFSASSDFVGRAIKTLLHDKG